MTRNETDTRKPTRSSARYWRSLSELRGTEDFDQFLDREFPVAASEFPEGVSRRRWMKLMGASLTLAGVSGCRYPEELIAPFVIRPEGRIPGESYDRATNFEWADRVYNLLVTCVDGRPIKIEPNNEHPSGGGTDVYSQASILSLYDPDRARGDAGFLLHKGEKRRLEVNWDEFDRKAFVKAGKSNNQGGKMAVLTPPTSSPSIVRMLKKLNKRLPNMTIARYDGVRGDAMATATKQVLGTAAQQVLNLADAKVVLTLQADILGSDLGMIGNARGFAENRDPIAGEMSRIYVVEGGYTITGASADSRLALRPSQMPALLSELERRLDALQGDDGHDHDHGEELPFDHEKIVPGERLERFLDVLSHDIAAAGADAVVVVGEGLSAEAVAAGIRLNKKLGSLGKLQTFMPLVDNDLGQTASLSELTTKINNGEVDTLLILGGNPVVTAPADIDFAAAIAKVEATIYLGDYDDETGGLCSWSLPLAHPLESWGDAINDHGYYGVCQPQILPLLGGRSVVEVLAAMLGDDETDGQQIVRRTADAISGKSLSEREWRQLLHDGFADEIKVVADELTPNGDGKPLTADGPRAIAAADINQDDIEVIFVPADGLYDGRFANNAWLQELPHALTKICWDNAAVMSPGTAKAIKIAHGDKVALRRADTKVELPVYEMPGCAPGVVTVMIGYGRTNVGAVGGDPDNDVDPVGIDVSPIRTSDAMMIAYQVEGRPNYNKYDISTTQNHWAIDQGGRDETEARSFSLVREGTMELFEKVRTFANEAPKAPHVPPVGKNDSGSPWTEPVAAIRNDPELDFIPQWGMSIDLSKCTGCNACVIACQSENNIPIVGREQVMNNREMHWIRIDRYFQGGEENADVVQQPVACVHCETAPCEQVCPVAATVHTEEGINAMAYNRCIGTRYCANNCPFKVRRFNYFNYNQEIGVGYGVKAYPGSIESANRKLEAMVLNPEVTVRGRGVMEKCSYCIQRVEKAKIDARKDGGRPVRDGDVVTACQSACPTKAIEFGNIEDPASVVAKKRDDPRSYGLLGQLNIKPRTEYLARVRNPHPRLMTAVQLEDLATIKSHHGDGHGDEHGAHGDEHGAHGDEHGAHGDEHGEHAGDHGDKEHSKHEEGQDDHKENSDSDAKHAEDLSV